MFNTHYRRTASRSGHRPFPERSAPASARARQVYGPGKGPTAPHAHSRRPATSRDLSPSTAPRTETGRTHADEAAR